MLIVVYCFIFCGEIFLIYHSTFGALFVCFDFITPAYLPVGKPEGHPSLKERGERVACPSRWKLNINPQMNGANPAENAGQAATEAK